MDVNTFKRKVKFVLKDNSCYRPTRGTKKGNLCPQKLYKYRVSDRIFQEKNETNKKLYNIIICVDCSGSMHIKYRDKPCAEAVTKIVDGLHGVCRLGILGYNRKLHKFWPISTNVPNLKDIKQKIIHTCWDEDHVCKKGDPVYYGNHDHMAIYESISILNKTPGKGIIIMLSDGQPNCDEHYGQGCGLEGCGSHYELKELLKKGVKDAERSKIDVLGIGIQTDVSEFYTNSEYVSNPADVYQTMFKFFEKKINTRILT